MEDSARIKSLWELRNVAENRLSVVCPWSHVWARPRPAAFMINLSGAVLIRLLDRGMYLYKKAEKT